MVLRGGTSKGAYFLAGDLPADPDERDRLLLAVMGSPDPRQIDGIGGAHPLTSKVAVIRRAEVPDVEVDYLFLQVQVDAPRVSAEQPCDRRPTNPRNRLRTIRRRRSLTIRTTSRRPNCPRSIRRNRRTCSPCRSRPGRAPGTKVARSGRR